ncbi:hypothetical protein [Dokdonella sp.]|uniref:hypothetical protein n=1 Tax=Dokdonella sp. TaxID=2291710 RepID=UPI003528E637
MKRCKGGACYGALASHFGTDSPKQLEWRVDGRRPYGRDSDAAASNKYRRWRQGKALPHKETILHVASRTAMSVRLDDWIDLPLWELLAPEPPAMQRIHELLEESPTAIRRILFMDSSPDRLGRYRHSMVNRQQTLAIRNQYSLDALIALLCLARKGEVLDDDPHHFLPSACAFDIFPRVLFAHQPLRYVWQELFSCIERIFWKRSYVDGMHYNFPESSVRSSLRALDVNPSAILACMSGKNTRLVQQEQSKSAG